MSQYLSKCWRGTKVTVASAQTLASSGVFLHGLLASGGALSIVLGTIGLACSALLWIDSKGNFEVARFVKQNEAILKSYRLQNEDFRNENLALQSNVEQLNQSLDKSAREVGSLQKLKEQYTVELSKLEKMLQDEKTQKASLATQVDRLDELRANFVSENDNLQQTLQSANEQKKQMAMLYEQARSSDATHRAQAEKLKTIVDSMQDLLAAVAHEGDQFEQFSKAIDTRLIDMDRQNQSLENTAHMMETLLERLTKDKFNSLDRNNDGVLTVDELAQ